MGTELLIDWRAPTGQAHGGIMAEFPPFSGNNYAGFMAASGAQR